MKEIQLTQGKVAIVDDEDYEWLNQWKWCVNSDGYAHRGRYIGGGKQVDEKMHRLVLCLKKNDGNNVDHINGIKTDNRKENLRVCTKSENSCNKKKTKSNTSGFKGVSWNRPNKKWCAQISIKRKVIYLGLFATKELAFNAYCEAAKNIHLDFSNFGE